MTKNRARKRATKALATNADMRHPDAAYLADHRKLRTPDWGVIDFAEGPLRLLGTENALNHYRPLEVVLQAAFEKRWRIVQLTTLSTRTLQDMLAYLRKQPTLTILLTSKGAPVNPVAVELLSGKHRDLNVAIQDTASREMHELIPGRIITFDIEDGADLEPMPPRITEWHAMVNQGGAVHGPINTIEWEPKDSPEVLRGAPEPTQMSNDFVTAINEAMREQPAAFILSRGDDGSPERVQLAPGVTGSGVTNALMRNFNEATFGSEESARLNGDPTPEAAPFSIITGRPGIGRTARGWAMIEKADAELIALGIPKAAQEFATYPDGLFLIAGLTGQGKTMTGANLLYRACVERPRKAYAIGHPIELMLMSGSGATPLPVEREGEAAAAIRDSVAAGADVILVDGIFGSDTAEAAVAAALSGVLVFATMHSTAADASARLVSMLPVPKEDGKAAARDNEAKVERALRGVIEQNLVRGEGWKGRALAAEVWVKDDHAGQPVLAPVLKMKDSYAALVAEGTIL